MNKEQKEAKQRYIHMFYNLIFKNLVSQCLVLYICTNNQLLGIEFLKKVDTSNMSMSQVKTVPLPSGEPQKPVGKQSSLKQQGSRYVTQFINHFSSF